MQFWENVYGFDMKCIGKEVLEDAATSPIVDTIDSKEIVTDTCLLQVLIYLCSDLIFKTFNIV